MSDDEPDYLSNEFLEACVPKDVRPGLLHRHAEKRKHEQLKQQERDNADNRKKNKSRSQLEEERREVGLKTAIGEDNKGYQLLAKMGFKPGSTIGPARNESDCANSASEGSASNSGSLNTRTALKEPISIVVKSDRKGLGGKSKLEEKRLQIEEWKQMRDELSDPNQYRDRVREQVTLKEIITDLKRSQNVCKNLDLQRDKTEPIQLWYWPKIPIPEDEEKEDQEEAEVVEEEPEIPEPEPQEQLKILTNYLRSEYYYCLWCGVNYDGECDLKDSCPGATRHDH